MIQLEKQNDRELTEQEIQDYVNRIYDYAADLYINQDKSWDQVEYELIKFGLSKADAKTVINNLKEEEHNAKKKSAIKEIGLGALCFFLGIILTAVTGGTVLFYGAVFCGAWLILKGLYHKIL